MIQSNLLTDTRIKIVCIKKCPLQVYNHVGELIRFFRKSVLVLYRVVNVGEPKFNFEVKINNGKRFAVDRYIDFFLWDVRISLL